ncbi:hypothetical protein GCM10018954_076880 [Kutzneria kofuensis]
MVLEFPDDLAAATLDRQYLLGDDLLVAPVFTDDGTVDYYVPDGTWTNILTGDRVTGPRWVRETARPPHTAAAGAPRLGHPAGRPRPAPGLDWRTTSNCGSMPSPTEPNARW